MDVLYTIIYDANNGRGSHIDADIPNGAEYEVLSPEETGIRRRGYTFIGWSTSSDNGGIFYALGDILTINQNETLYAQWKLNLYTVIYDANGGKGGYSDADISHGTEYTVLAPEAIGIHYKGDTFISWNEKPDGSGTSYMPEDVVTLIRDIPIYAQWRENTKQCREGFCDEFCRDFSDEYSICDDCEDCQNACCQRCNKICSGGLSVGKKVEETGV